MTIRRQPNGQYAIDSETSEKSYIVSETSCSCPHHQYRGVECKHMTALKAHLTEQTALGRAAEKAAHLTEPELLRFAREKNGTSAGAACLLELACRRRAVQAEHQPEVDLAHHTCTCREFTERRDGKRIGVMFVTCQHLQAARKAAQPEPRPIPAGVEAFLVGASPEERERALAVYG